MNASSDRDRDREDRHDRRGDVPEEEQDHQAHDQHLQHELVLQGVDRALDQLRAVVGRDDAHALGQRRLDLPEPLAHALDHGARVLAVAHDHDAAHGVAAAVEIGDAAADLGAERDLGHVAQQHRRPERVDAQHDLLEIGRRVDVAAAADHVLLARHLDEPAAHLDVGAAHRLGDLHDPEAVGLQPVRVDRDLVLLLEAPEARPPRRRPARTAGGSAGSSPGTCAGRRGCASRSRRRARTGTPSRRRWRRARARCARPPGAPPGSSRATRRRGCGPSRCRSRPRRSRRRS